MTPQRWEQIKQVFTAALEGPPEERGAFLDAKCADDAELRAEMQQLVQEGEEPSLPSPVEGLLRQPGEQPVRALQIVNNYLILKRIGIGGMSVVYKALDIRLGRPVALKFLPSELGVDEQARASLVNEAATAASLDHPNIESVYGMEEGPSGQLFIVMAYFEGETLAERLRRGPLPVTEAAAIARQIASGLAEAHAHQVVHRDIKPSNIILTRQGAAKIVDFGIARIIQSADSTRSLNIAGTAAYMSPEQAQGQLLDSRTDLWSLGAVIYEMVAGRPPFGGDDLPVKLAAIVNAAPPDLSPEIPAAMQEVIYRALAKKREERFQSAVEMVEDLERVCAGVSVPAATLAEVKRHSRPRLLRKTRSYLSWLLAAIAAPVLAVLWWLIPLQPPKPAAYQMYLKAVEYVQHYEKPENLDEAIALLKEAIKADPKFALAVASLGQAYWQKARLTGDRQLLAEAEKTARRALALNSRLPRVHTVMGMIQRSLGNLELSEEEFQRALELQPSNADSLIGLAGVYQGQQRLSEAENLYRRAVTLYPDSWEAHNSLGLFLRTQKRLGEAGEEFRGAIHLTPDNVAAYLNLSTVLIDANKFDEAKQVLGMALDRRPSSYTAAAVYTNLGAIYALQRRFVEAEENTSRALKLNDRDWVTWKNLAQIKRWLDDDTAAVEAYKRVLPLLEHAARASPQDAALQAELAEVYAYCGDRAKAVARIEIALALAPGDYVVSLSGAKAFAALGDTDRAVALANDSVRQGLTLADLDQEPEARWFRSNPHVRTPSK